MRDTRQQQSPAQVRVDRSYPFAVDKVWRAWTDPQALSRWFGHAQPGTVTEAEINLRERGRYRIVSRLPDGATNEVSGQYQQVLPHRPRQSHPKTDARCRRDGAPVPVSHPASRVGRQRQLHHRGC